jgi:hypothetical protein
VKPGGISETKREYLKGKMNELLGDSKNKKSRAQYRGVN